MPKQNSEKQLVQIPMGTGLDESTPASILSPGKLASCINGSISRTGSVELRKGFAAMPPVDLAGNAVFFKDVCSAGDGESSKDGYVAFDATSILTYSESANRWNRADLAPEAQLVRVDSGERGILAPSVAVRNPFCDSIAIGAYRAHAWHAINAAAAEKVRVRVVDTTANSECRVPPSDFMCSAKSGTRLLKHGTKIYCVYRELPATIVARVFDTAAPLSGWSAPTTIAPDMDIGIAIWEACVVGSFIFLAYNQTGGMAAPRVMVDRYNLALVLQEQTLLADGAMYGIGINGSTTANVLYVAFDHVDGATGMVAHGLQLSDVTVHLWGGLVFDAANIYAVVLGASSPKLERIGIAINPTTYAARVVFSLGAYDPPGPTHEDPELRYWDITHLGVAAASGKTWNVSMLGLPFFRDSAHCYVPAMVATKPWHWYTARVTPPPAPTSVDLPIPRIQGNSFLLAIETGLGWPARVVIRLCPYLTGSFAPLALYSCAIRPVTVDPIDASSYLMAHPKLADGSIDIDVGFDIYTFTFGLPGDKRPIRLGPVSIFSGGVPTQWDGDRLTEIGWHYYPRIGTVAGVVGGGGMIPAEQYSYVAVYIWEDAKGQRHFSTASLPRAIVMGAFEQSASIEVDTLTLTEREDLDEEYRPVIIELYRTLAAPSQDYYFVSRLRNDPTVASVTFLDPFGDTAISENKMIPTRGGVATSGCPGAVSQFAAHNGRPFAIMAEDPGQIAFGQYTLTGEAPRMPDGWVLRCAQGAEYVAIGSLGDKLIAWQRHSIDAIYGTGPNDTGLGGQFSDPQRICGTVGCSTRKGLVRYPEGFLFFAESGWWTIDEGFKTEYRGASVADSVDTYPDIQASFLDDSNYRIVVLCSRTDPQAGDLPEHTHGVALVWYYPWNMWTRWEIPSHSEVALDPLVGGCVGYRSGERSIYLCTAEGIIEREQAICQDHAAYWVTLDLATGWISPAGLQGFGHQWNVNVLGTYREAHTVRGVIFYDYDSAQSSGHAWTVSGIAAAVSGTRLQLCMQPTRAEAQAIKISMLLSADPDTAVTGECSRLEAITIEAAQEPGVGLLSAEAKR